MKLSHVVVLILLPLLFLSACIAGARLLGQNLPTHYNCLRSNNVDIQLNRHLTIYRQRFYTYLAYPFYHRYFLSPDKHYELIYSYDWKGDTAAVLLKDRHTGLFTNLFKDADRMFDKREVVGWSPDSQFVAYAEMKLVARTETIEQYQSSFLLYSIASNQSARIKIHDSELLSFSPDNQFVTVRTGSDEITTISLRTFQPEYSVSLPDLGYRLVWSPVGHRLALWSHHGAIIRVVIIDLDKKTHRLFSLLDLDTLYPWRERRYGHTLHWSPDGTYVALYGFDNRWTRHPQFGSFEHYITVFSADGGDPTRLSSRPDGTKIDHLVGWTQEGQLQYVMYDHISSTSPYTLWTFNPKTNEHQVVAAGTPPPVVENMVPSSPQAPIYGADRFPANRDDQRLEIVDSETGNIYVFPEKLKSTLPHDVFDPEVPLAVDVSPSPDGQVWLVSVDYGQSVYHVRPAENRWRLVYQDGSMRLGNVLWSPDSRRVAFWRGPMMARNPNLMVVEAKDGKVWNLGNVGNLIWNMSWQQCGGVRTALFGDTTFGIGR